MILDIHPGLMASLYLVAGFGLLLSALSTRSAAARVSVAFFAIFFNLHYLQWRFEATLFSADAPLAMLWSWCIVLFEAVAVLAVSLHFLVLTRRSDRTRLADAAEARLRAAPTVPTVDVFVATVDESREILERTLRAARELDYPSFEVWVLDDGDRPWLRAYCEEAGIHHLARPSREGFKAGNQNHALPHSQGELILCLDADFAVDPRFLYRTVGLFEDPSVGIVQTPQVFLNPDPIQVNLGGEAAWPEEQKVFTDIVQPARDAWDNAFCYGTNFVIRRRCVEEIGGFPEQSLCEDFLTTYRLKAKGYVTRYLGEPLAVGLAAESLPEFIKQRVRWAVGTLQCLLLPVGPLRARGLSLIDRIFFLDPMLYYVGFLWVALMLVAPAVFWWTGLPPFQSELGHFLTMVAPRMGVSMLALYWLSEKRVVPFFSELGRIVGIFYLAPAVLVGLFRPSGHPFRVTAKGHRREAAIFRWGIAWPHLALAAATIAGMVLNLWLPGFRLVAWNQGFGLALALTVYALWMSFFAVLTCVEPARPSSVFGQAAGARTGSFLLSLAAIVRRIAG